MTDRQAKLLNAIIETYASTAEPVGSLGIAQSLGYSPATIRAEMAELERLGLITHPHTSAGRIPTDKGYRQYVNQIASAQSPTQRTAAVLKRRLSDITAPEEAIKYSAESMARLTGNLAIATLPGYLYRYGLSYLMHQPEFFGRQESYEVARLLDSLEDWLSEAAPSDPLSVYIGQENPIGKSSGCSLIVARFVSPFSDRSYLGVIGPTRQSYNEVMNLVDYTARQLEESLNA